MPGLHQDLFNTTLRPFVQLSLDLSGTLELVSTTPTTTTTLNPIQGGGGKSKT